MSSIIMSSNNVILKNNSIPLAFYINNSITLDLGMAQKGKQPRRCYGWNSYNSLGVKLMAVLKALRHGLPFKTIISLLLVRQHIDYYDIYFLNNSFYYIL
jgi:hypothetical protein